MTFKFHTFYIRCAQAPTDGPHPAHHGLLSNLRHPRKRPKVWLYDVCLANYSFSPPSLLLAFWTCFKRRIPPQFRAETHHRAR